MRVLPILIAALAASACATSPEVEQGRMPPNIVRDEGGSPRLGDVRLEAGSYAEGAPFSFSITFAVDGKLLGAPTSVGWTSKFGDYCRNHGSWLQTVLTGPDGREWRGRRVYVPAGPDRAQDWSTGSTGAIGPGAVDTPGLLEAAAVGGVFTVSLENDQGERWPQGVFETFSEQQRQRMFDGNLKALRNANPEMPARSDMLVVERREFVQPHPPRPCPGA